ncbi:MAG TPA: DUF362 domain-containing protein, partial [Bacillota bacterium]|nr:DUF362 domain-containing protein [Bacillota bacterium]
LKPNLVDPKPSGSGEITDVRVIKALIKLIDELHPGKVEIIVGEGSPRPLDYELKYQSRFQVAQWEKLWDKAGYQELLTDPDLKGINFRFSNLNGSPANDPWKDLVEVAVPGGGQALPQGGKYFIHKDVLEADVYITVPVMKIHNPGITAALKNQIGIAPSTLYGFEKTRGVPQDEYRHKLTHVAAPYYWTDKEIVDLSKLAKIKFVVVDALNCLEYFKTIIRSKTDGRILNQVRMNTVIAGSDAVAVDHVCARLTGVNPDDVEHITLAEKVGLGTNDPRKIQIVGADLEKTKRKFRKNPTAQGDFGQSNREWLVSGPFAVDKVKDPLGFAFIKDEVNLNPQPGIDGWSEGIYFTEDRIDLGQYFKQTRQNGPVQMVGYAFTLFDAPRDQEAELWVGTDEALRVYLNGKVVYDNAQPKIFTKDDLVNDKVKVQLKAGENRLLVKALQKEGYFHFTLNICEPDSNAEVDGNRVWGLKFRLPVAPVGNTKK